MSEGGKQNGAGSKKGAKPQGITARWKAVRSANTAGVADWNRCDGAALLGLVSAVANSGGAILLGYSRDRGAYRVIIMDDDDKVTEWIPCNTDVTYAVEALADSLGTSQYYMDPDAP